MIVNPRDLRKLIENTPQNSLMACVIGKLQLNRNGSEWEMSMFNFIDENILKGSPQGWYIDQNFLRQVDSVSGQVSENFIEFRGVIFSASS